MSQHTDEVSEIMQKSFCEVYATVREALVQAQERLEAAVLAQRERDALLVQEYIDKWRGTSAEQVFVEMQTRIRSDKS